MGKKTNKMKPPWKDHGIFIVASFQCAQFDRDGKLIKEGKVLFDHRKKRKKPIHYYGPEKPPGKKK